MTLKCLVLLFLHLQSVLVTCVMHKIWPCPSIKEVYGSSQQTNVLRVFELPNPPALRFVYRDEAKLDRNDDEMINAAFDRLRKVIRRMIPDDADEYPINPEGKRLISIEYIDMEIKPDSSLNEEYYEIQIDNFGGIELFAKSALGIIRSMQSLWQLISFGWYSIERNPVFVIPLTPLQIVDSPAYPYRGLLIDTARHYLPVSLLEQQLDVLEWNKMNVLHWHITDSQSWPFESAVFPELSRAGSYCKECVYRVSDIRHIVAQAALRGIRVIVEIDFPGHCQGNFTILMPFTLRKTQSSTHLREFCYSV